jgi:polyphosphate kinase
MRKRFIFLIQKEIENAQKGKTALIILKMNNLVDREMILKLYEASRAGVKIRLLIRGTCSLVPGVKGFSENIEAFSIVGRFLEHSRVFIFYNGGDEKYFISSADWMSRNLDHRSEVAVPIYDRDSQQELRQIIALQLRDNRKARILGGKEENSYRRSASQKPLIAQDEIRLYLERKAKTARPRIISKAPVKTSRPVKRKAVKRPARGSKKVEVRRH